MTLDFTALEDGGVEIFDTIERHQYLFGTPEPVSIEAADADALEYPVDDAISIRTDAIELPENEIVLVHDRVSGEVVKQVSNLETASLPKGTYALELGSHIKTYLLIDSPLEIEAGVVRRTVDFDDQVEVIVSARSMHEHPEGTITTTTDPRDMMRAISLLGTALKSTNPERSFPTLRGHPPLIELGDEFEAPPELDGPDTDVIIEVPPSYNYIFVVAPLAYYLGATLTPSDEPRITTNSGFVHHLEGARGFEREVARVLKQTVLFDCITRTEGLYPMTLHERNEVEQVVEFDFSELYKKTVGEQLEQYLSVPYRDIESYVPEWKLTTHITPDASSIEMLPFVVYDLGIIRTPQESKSASPATETTSEQSAAVDGFLRTTSGETIEPSSGEIARAATDDDFMRSATSSGGSQTNEGGDFVRSASSPEMPSKPSIDLKDTDSLEHAWIGDGAPSGVTKPTIEAFHNGLNREPSDGEIDIVVVCNDSEMAEEHDYVREAYGSRENLPHSVTVHRDVASGELRSILSESVEFLHYIGHIDADGFECPDGRLDAHELDQIGVNSFFLNACTSYQQGMALLESGAISGVVTRRDVINSGAVKVGSRLAELLNHGFSMYGGLDIASKESIIGSQYSVIGDGGFTVLQDASATISIRTIERISKYEYELTARSYLTRNGGMGTLIRPFIESVDEYFIAGGESYTLQLSKPELMAYVQQEKRPFIYDDELYWSNELLGELSD